MTKDDVTGLELWARTALQPNRGWLMAYAVSMGGDLDQITDGIRKCGEFDLVEMGEGLQWIQVDLA